jgi:hypothetical protein
MSRFLWGFTRNAGDAHDTCPVGKISGYVTLFLSGDGSKKRLEEIQFLAESRRSVVKIENYTSFQL